MAVGKDAYRITSVSRSAGADRKARTKRYLISMGIRTICLICAVVIQGPIRWVFVAAAVFLPYFAVIGANSPVRKSAPVETPPFIVNNASELGSSEIYNPVSDSDDSTNSETR